MLKTQKNNKGMVRKYICFCRTIDQQVNKYEETVKARYGQTQVNMYLHIKNVYIDRQGLKWNEIYRLTERQTDSQTR